MLKPKSNNRAVFVFGLRRISLRLFVVSTAALFMFALALSLIQQPSTASAATNDTINFQARLLSNVGNIAPDGDYNVQFNIYDASSGSTALWTETRTSANRVRVANGYLSVSLGSVTPFPADLDWSQDLWLTMNIGGASATASWDGEMNPRLHLTAVPYAMSASNAVRANSAAILKGITGSNVSTLGFGSQTSSNSILLPDESGTVCIAGSINCGFLKNGTTSQSANFNIKSTSPSKVTGSLQATTGQTADVFRVLDSSGSPTFRVGATGNVTASKDLAVLGDITAGTDLAVLGATTLKNTTVDGDLNTTGQVSFQNSTNSTTAFQILNAAGTDTVLNVDTTNQKVKVGTDLSVGNNADITNDLAVGNSATIGTAETYAIGDTGPGGGIVFYDKGSVSDGWRYLEAAPSGWNGGSDPLAEWGCYGTAISGADGTAIGTGKQNTADMLAAGCSPDTPGDDLAQDLATNYTGGGKSDWYLPSKDELNQLYTQKTVVGGFTSNYFWSSSENSSPLAWGQYFVNGAQFNDGKYATFGVRPIRGFSGASSSDALTVHGSASFGSTVSGADAVANDDFTTLGQLNSLLGSASTNAILNGGNAFGTDITIGSTDNYGLNLMTNGNTVQSFDKFGAVNFKSSQDSSSAFSIQNTSGSSLFKVDTYQNNVVIGNGSSSITIANNGVMSSWKTNTNALPASVTFSSAVSANGYVYVFNSNTVYYAKQSSDGSLGSWTTSPSTLPSGGSADSGSLAANGHIYVFGGSHSNKVFYAELNSNGSVGSWQTNANPLPEARSSTSAVTANGYVYIIGGSNNSEQTVDTVYYAKLNSDGSTGSWTTSANSLSFTAYGSSSIYGDYVYFVGANNELTVTMLNVQYAKLNKDGTTSAWQSGNSLPKARSNSVVTTANGYLYVSGGYDGGPASNTTYYAPLDQGGSIGSWQTASATLPQSLGGAAGTQLSGYIYYMGGFDGGSAKNMVYYTSLQRTVIQGSTVFNGSAIGQDAIKSNEFTTLGQVQGMVSAAGANTNAILNGGNAFGSDIIIGTTDNYDVSFVVNGSEVLGLSTAGAEVTGTLNATVGITTPSLDTATTGTLSIGTTTASTINIGKDSGTTNMAGQIQMLGTTTGYYGSRLKLGGTFSSSYTGQQYGFDNRTDFTPTGASVYGVYGLLNIPTLTGTSLDVNNFFGQATGLVTASDYTGQITNGMGISVNAPSLSGSKPITRYTGINISANSANGGNTSGYITNQQLRVSGTTIGAGTGGTVNNYGINLVQPSGTGGTTNNYGIYVQGNGAGNKNYSIYNDSTADSYYAGNIGIGTDSPSYALDVSGGTGIVGSFSGRVKGADATANNEFTTLGQLNSLLGSANTNAILNGGNAFGSSVVIGTNDNYDVSFVVNGTEVLGLSTTGADITGDLTTTGDVAVGTDLSVTGDTNLKGTTVTGDLDVTGDLTSNGQATFQNTTDSTTAFQVLNAAGTDTVLNVDTTNQKVKVGTDLSVGNNADITNDLAVGNSATIGTAETYAIGDTGPGGGIVFYDKGSVSDGWRYLEAAPSGWDGSSDPAATWCSDTFSTIGASGTAIGTGKVNTTTMLSNCSSGAANLAAGYTGGGKSDWYLPSKDELNQLYSQKTVVGGLLSGDYWSSSEYSSTAAWEQYLVDGNQHSNGKADYRYVRLIRGFSGASSTDALTVHGSASFGGTVSGADALSNNEFTTLGQVNNLLGGASTDAILNGGNAFGADIVIGTTDNYNVSFVVNGSEVLGLSTAGASVTGTLDASAGVTAPSLDTASAGTLTIAGANATGVTIGAPVELSQSLTSTALMQLTGTLTTASNSRLWLSGTLKSSNISSQYSLVNDMAFNPTGASLDHIFGWVNTPSVTGSSLDLDGFWGGVNTISTTSGYTGKIQAGYGFQVGSPAINGSQKISRYYGIDIRGVSSNGGNTSGLISNRQLNIGENTASAGVGGRVDNYGIMINQSSGTGGTTNNYGLYIKGNGSGVSGDNYAIYSNSSADSFLSGDLNIGSSLSVNSSLNTKNLTVTGTASGQDAVANNEFATLGQVNGLISAASGGDLLSTGNSLGTDIVIGTNDNYDVSFVVNGSKVLGLSTAGADVTGDLTVTGTASGQDAVANNEFATLGQVNGLLGTASTNAILNGGNAFGTAVTLGTVDSYGVNFQVGGSVAMSIGSSGDVQIGGSSNNASFDNNGQLTFSGDARRARQITLTPEYAGAVLDADSDAVCSLASSGTMTSGLDLTNRMNYYKWTSAQPTSQCYDIAVQVPVPSDFSYWASTKPLTINTYSSNTSNATAAVELRDSTGSVIYNFANITPSSTSTWQARTVGGTISGTYTVGDYITLRVRTSSKSSANMQIGNITLNYLSKW